MSMGSIERHIHTSRMLLSAAVNEKDDPAHIDMILTKKHGKRKRRRRRIATTGGGFAIHRSVTLGEWALAGSVFDGEGGRLAWANGDFWAPEIHQVDIHAR